MEDAMNAEKARALVTAFERKMKSDPSVIKGLSGARKLIEKKATTGESEAAWMCRESEFSGNHKVVAKMVASILREGGFGVNCVDYVFQVGLSITW